MKIRTKAKQNHNHFSLFFYPFLDRALFHHKKGVMLSCLIKNNLIILIFLAFFSSQNIYANNLFISFVGSTVVDLEAECSAYANSTITIKRNGAQISVAAGGTKPDFQTLYFRDTGLTKGATYNYTYCCKGEISNGSVIDSCQRDDLHKVTTGEVKGTIKLDLTINNEDIVFAENARLVVEKGVTLNINNSTINKHIDAGYASIVSQTLVDGKITDGGVIRIQDSIISSAVKLTFRSSGDNLLVRNTIGDDTIDKTIHNDVEIEIKNQANVTIESNSISIADFLINGASTTNFYNNTIQSSEFDINDRDGRPVVYISGNDFIQSSNEALKIAAGKITIRNNSFTGKEWTPGSNNSSAIISNRPEAQTSLHITDNTFTDYAIAISLDSTSDVSVSGNTFTNNQFALKTNDYGASANNNSFIQAIYNSFIDNRTAVSITERSESPEVTTLINNNCFVGSTASAISRTSSAGITREALNAVENWWGSINGPFHRTGNPAEGGDRISDDEDYKINYTPWLTQADCENNAIIPDFTLVMISSTDSLAADGESQATITLSLRDSNNNPTANASLSLTAPTIGTLNQLSGTTNSQGELKIVYTSPTMDALNGKPEVTLEVKYADANIDDSLIITFKIPNIATWASPNTSPYPKEQAIIPGDERFPGRYQFTLRDGNGQPMANEQLTVSIANQSIARLEADNQTGRQLELFTDDQGKVSVDYIYTGELSDNKTFLQDTIMVNHESLIKPKEAIVSIGLRIEPKQLLTVLRDTGAFPQTLGMRIQLHDTFRQDMDLRAYLHAVEAVSGHNIGANVEVEWLNKPVPAMIDRFSSIVPNLTNIEPPELYDSIGVINYGDQALSEIIIETQDEPQVSFGENTFPAIVFEDPGNYWFHIKIDPVILLENDTSASEELITGIGSNGINHIFEVNIEEGVESVFQSLACSVKPTDMGQLALYTLLIDNPWSFLDFWPSTLAVKGTFKTIGVLCDVMRGNYITAAANLATLRVDILEKTFNTGQVAMSITEYERLKKLIKLNNMYYKISNFSDVSSELSNIVQSRNRNPFPINLPEDITLEQYTDMFRQVISGELRAYDDLANWQYVGIINNGEVKLNKPVDDSQQFSQGNVHVFLLPPEVNTLEIETNDNADIFRYYRASSQEVFNADYQFISQGINNLLSMNLMETGLQIDQNDDGAVNSIFTPDISKIQTENPIIRLALNKESYQIGDTLTLSVSIDNPGEALLVDGYFILQDSTGLTLSLPEFSPGLKPLVSNYLLPEKLQLPMTQVISLKIPADFPWTGQLQAIATMTYPGTQDAVGGKSSTISFNLK